MFFNSQSKSNGGRNGTDDSEDFETAIGSDQCIGTANNDKSAATASTTSLSQFLNGGQNGGALRRAEATKQRLGSTFLAEFGKKYQVDQSVNLMDLEDAAHPTERNKRRQSRQIPFGTEPPLEGSNIDDPSKWSPQKPRQLIMMHHELKPSIWGTWREMLCLWPVIVAAVVLPGTWVILYFSVFNGSTVPVEGNSVTAFPKSATFTTTLAPTVAPDGKVTPVAPTTAALDDVVLTIIPATTAVSHGDNHMHEVVHNLIKQKSSSQSEPQGLYVVTSPSPALSRANQKERWKDLVGLISRKKITPIEDFDDPTTSAFKALDWMVEYDQGADMEVISSDTALHILETYGLAVFFFATHPSIATSAVKSFSSTNSSNSLLMQVWRNDWIHQTKSKCHWEGVGCGHLHNVVTLNVTHGHLAGTLPRELSALEQMIFMDLSFNSIGGTLPSEWANAWPFARSINVSHNLLEGSVPDTWNELWLGNPDVTINLSHNENLEGSTN